MAKDLTKAEIQNNREVWARSREECSTRINAYSDRVFLRLHLRRPITDEEFKFACELVSDQLRFLVAGANPQGPEPTT